MRRHIKRRDLNHDEIVRDCKAAGLHVIDLHNVGGCPDLLVAGYHGSGTVPLPYGGPSGLNLLVEVKSEGGQLSDDQKEFFETWPGPKIVAYSSDDVLRWFGKVKQP